MGARHVDDVKDRFERAVAKSRTLTQRPDNPTLLKIYALYKQATVGDVEGEQPGFIDMVGRAKYDAWAALAGKPADEAMKDYIALIDRLAEDAF
jgi:diazepam-binding inhibitor (GABA receptor modulating acyl-CoA-binding protein)